MKINIWYVFIDISWKLNFERKFEYLKLIFEFRSKMFRGFLNFRFENKTLFLFQTQLSHRTKNSHLNLERKNSGRLERSSGLVGASEKNETLSLWWSYTLYIHVVCCTHKLPIRVYYMSIYKHIMLRKALWGGRWALIWQISIFPEKCCHFFLRNYLKSTLRFSTIFSQKSNDPIINVSIFYCDYFYHCLH